MKNRWIDTFGIYESIISAPDATTREKIYREQLYAPWQQMMQMVAMGGQNTDDPFAGAKAWHWLTPDQLTSTPEQMTILQAAHAWERGAAAMQKAVDSFTGDDERIPIEEIEGWLVLAEPMPDRQHDYGYTGGTDFMQPRFVVQYSQPNAYNLPKLEGAIVHEMHHLIRYKVAPWNIMTATLADYIVHEGLAESFAAALYGETIVGFYVTEFDDADIATAKQLVGDNLDVTGFDTLRSFIFGDQWTTRTGGTGIGMPAFGGYAIGYRVVQAFLKKTGRTIQEATFMSASEIVAASGYFA
ncbi:MAG: hypothetical protein KC546_09180 [Anaerolineae bacterium]|nr:hypothetical protein [Anaerolineae bacterium]